MGTQRHSTASNGWRDYLSAYDCRRHRAEAVLKLSPGGATRLPWLLEPAAADAARRTATGPDAAGWVQVTIPIESVDQALPELLKLGADAEVLAPDELRGRITELLETLTAVYRRSDGTPHTTGVSGPADPVRREGKDRRRRSTP